MPIAVNALPGPLGATVTGVDARWVPDQASAAALHRALADHGVLVLPGQRLAPAEQVAFTAALGPVEDRAHTSPTVPGQREVVRVGSRPGAVSYAPRTELAAELEWHADLIQCEVPAHVSVLHGIEIPPVGGDTLFACMHTAWDLLDTATRARCAGLRVLNTLKALNEFRRSAGADPQVSGAALVREGQAAVHPLVRSHPLTGRQALYFGARVSVAAEGVEPAEFLALRDRLVALAGRAEVGYRHRWQPGDLVLWDNRRVLHAATAFDPTGGHRLLHRSTVRETVLPVR